MNCSEIRPNLEAYALDALDPSMRAEVDAHLKKCAACRRRAESLRAAASELPRALGAASPLRPPAALKTKLMQAAQADIQAHAVRETFAPRAGRPAPARRGFWLFQPRLRVAAVGLLGIAIIALFLWTVSANARMQEALSNEQSALAQMDALKKQQELALPVLNSLNAQAIALEPTELLPDAVGKVLLEPNNPTIVFVGNHLPIPPRGQEYVLWTTTKGVMQPVGHFVPNEHGFALVAFRADRDDPVLKEIFVTRQPASQLLPSVERVLVWKSDPSDFSGEITIGSIYPNPSVTPPRR